MHVHPTGMACASNGTRELEKSNNAKKKKTNNKPILLKPCHRVCGPVYRRTDLGIFMDFLPYFRL